MGNHLDAEFVAVIFLSILWIYSRGSKVIHTLRNRLFQALFFSILLSISINSVYLFLATQERKAEAALSGILCLHFLFAPLTVLICSMYMHAYISEETGEAPLRGVCCLAAPYAGYAAAVLAGFFSYAYFSGGHAGEPFLTERDLVYLFYCGAMFRMVYRGRNRIQPDLNRGFLMLPSEILFFAVLQRIFPEFLFSDIASAGGLLIACLYLQNRHLAEDQLTGAPNRTAYLKTLDFLIRKSSAFVVMAISLNDFKFINDKFGQTNGDLFLREIVGFLRQIVPANGVFRVGGDTFAAIFEGRRLETAKPDIYRIAGRFASPWEIPRCVCHIGASIGVACYPAAAGSCGDLVSALESAVEHARKTGINRPVFCDREAIEYVRRRHEIYETLCAALKEETLEVYYQPLYSIEKNRFTEAEALVRLRGEDGGLISPDRFIPIAEETGLIEEIGYFVLRQVCESVRRFLQQGAGLETVSVNLSVVQLTKPDFVTRVLQIIKDSGVTPDRIIFEITESILISNYEMIADKIKSLGEAGIRFALDDFGTGYSNLAQVIDLPFNTVKIDKSLIWDSMDNRRCQLMVQNLTNAFKAIDLLITAEGVETREHDDFVRACGCDRIQGFRYACPLPWEQAAEYMGKSPEEIH